MSNQEQETLRAEKLPEQINVRRTRGMPRRSALGHGLGALSLHNRLRAAGRVARLLREEPVPRGMPSWARTWARKVWRLGRKV